MSKARDIREAVEAALRFDPLVDSSGVMVKNMDGEVALDGTVPAYPQYLQAAVAARRVAGVTSVHSHLEVVLPPGDERDDPLLATAANNTLTQNGTVPAGVEATARHGDLTLTGTVSYGSQRAAAEAAVAALTGVRGIRNKIEVNYDTEPAHITIAVRHALARSALAPDDSDVVVDTDGNAVTLTGHVRTAAEHDAVVSATWMADGVSAVIDELHVTG